MKNKRFISYLCIMLIGALILSGCGKQAKLKNGDKTAVAVGKYEITAKDYYDSIKEKEIGKLIDMIDAELLEKDFPADDEEKKYIEDQVSQMKANYAEGDDEQFQTVIKQYFGVESEKELKELLSMEYKRNLAVKQYISDNLTDDEIKEYYDNNITGKIKARHILITADVDSNASDDDKTKAEEEAYKKAKELIKQLDKGKKFETLAKKNSKDTTSAVNGGLLDYFYPSDMVTEFADAVKSLKKGEYTKEPVKTKYGYHIILKVDEKDKASLEDSKDDIKEKLTTQKLDNDKELYYQSLIDYRKDKGLKWNDSKLKKAYNDYMNNLIESTKSN